MSPHDEKLPPLAPHLAADVKVDTPRAVQAIIPADLAPQHYLGLWNHVLLPMTLRCAATQGLIPIIIPTMSPVTDSSPAAIMVP
jgi:hypothetical protein